MFVGLDVPVLACASIDRRSCTALSDYADVETMVGSPGSFGRRTYFAANPSAPLDNFVVTVKPDAV